MALKQPETASLVNLSIRVPASANDSLADAAAAVVERADAVESVERLQITDVTPRSNAVVVAAEAALVIDADLDPPTAALDAVVGVTVTAE